MLTAATAGNFGGSPTSSVSLNNGAGTADFSCLKSADTSCAARVRVDLGRVFTVGQRGRLSGGRREFYPTIRAARGRVPQVE